MQSLDYICTNGQLYIVTTDTSLATSDSSTRPTRQNRALRVTAATAFHCCFSTARLSVNCFPNGTGSEHLVAPSHRTFIIVSGVCGFARCFAYYVTCRHPGTIRFQLSTSSISLVHLQFDLWCSSL